MSLVRLFFLLNKSILKAQNEPSSRLGLLHLPAHQEERWSSVFGFYEPAPWRVFFGGNLGPFKVPDHVGCCAKETTFVLTIAAKECQLHWLLLAGQRPKMKAQRRRSDTDLIPPNSFRLVFMGEMVDQDNFQISCVSPASHRRRLSWGGRSTGGASVEGQTGNYSTGLESVLRTRKKAT